MDIQLLLEKNYEWLKDFVTYSSYRYKVTKQDAEDLTHDIIVELIENNVVDKGEWGSVIHRVLDRQSKRNTRNRETTRLPDDH